MHYLVRDGDWFLCVLKGFEDHPQWFRRNTATPFPSAAAAHEALAKAPPDPEAKPRLVRVTTPADLRRERVALRAVRDAAVRFTTSEGLGLDQGATKSALFEVLYRAGMLSTPPARSLVKPVRRSVLADACGSSPCLICSGALHDYCPCLCHHAAIPKERR